MLGYRPKDAWCTPIPELVRAYEEKIKWVRMCNGEDVRPPAKRIESQLMKVDRIFGMKKQGEKHG